MAQKNISQAAMTELLRSVKGAKFATITMETQQDMRKTNNPYYGRVTKRSTVNVTLNAIYKNSVTKALKRQGFSNVTAQNVVVGERAWGERLGSSCFVMHKGHMYLSAKLNAKPQKVTYFLDGEVMSMEDKKAIGKFLPTPKPQAVPVASIRVENIKELKIDKQHFIIEG